MVLGGFVGGFVGGFGWFWVVLGRFGWFRVLVTTTEVHLISNIGNDCALFLITFM